jgi:hypothetical protein
MNPAPMKTLYARFRPRFATFLCALGACALLGAGSPPATAATTAKVTPLGFELIPPHFPNSQYEDILQSLRITSAYGSHSSFIWHWGDAGALPLILPTLPVMKEFGLKSFVQMGAVFIKDPAPPPGYVPSFANLATRQKYLSDIELVARSKPDYLVLVTEANLLARFNPAEFEYYRTLYAAAYQAVKRISPQTSVGASYLYSVWFPEYFLDGKNVPDMLKPYDFIAFTAYPIDMITDGFFPDVASIPAEWYGSLRVAYPGTPVIFSELGWPSKHLGTPESQADFVAALPRLLSTVKPELATWAVLHDMEFFTRDILDAATVEFLISLGVDIDALFIHFNGMGLLTGYGVPKPAMIEATELVFTP